jgi:hypothetical protein
MEEAAETPDFEVGARVSSRREYKKDSIYVSDLYTLTYDEGETIECSNSLSTTEVSTFFANYFVQNKL